MKIGLIDVDGHNFPNLALMKLSSFHKSIGDTVEWVSVGNYDRTYISKVFSFSPDYVQGFSNLGEVVKGGTGYNYDKLHKLIDNCLPDYSIYPKFTEAYGYLTRGCVNHCNWCVVPEKEGDIRPYADIEDIMQGRRSAILMDNNILACNWGIAQIEKIVKLKIKVDFNQGMDCRFIANDKIIADLLSKVKWIKYLRMACDTKSQIPYIEKALENLNAFGFKNYRVSVYVLIKDIPDALERIEFLRKMGCDSFAQPYRDFKNNIKPTIEQKRFARWVNHRATFNSCEWKNYNYNN